MVQNTTLDTNFVQGHNKQTSSSSSSSSSSPSSSSPSSSSPSSSSSSIQTLSPQSTSSLSSDYNELYHAVLKENKLLQTQIQNNAINDNIDDKLSFYQIQKITTYKQLNFIFYCIYESCILLLLIYLFRYNLKLHIMYKILWILFFMIYPFVIVYLEKTIYFLFGYLFSIYIGEPYAREERQNPFYNS